MDKLPSSSRIIQKIYWNHLLKLCFRISTSSTLQKLLHISKRNWNYTDFLFVLQILINLFKFELFSFHTTKMILPKFFLIYLLRSTVIFHENLSRPRNKFFSMSRKDLPWNVFFDFLIPEYLIEECLSCRNMEPLSLVSNIIQKS